MIVSAVEEAVAQGASRKEASELIGVSDRTEQRWRKNPGGEDAREGPKSTPKHTLTTKERAEIVAIVTSKEFRNMSVRQIVPLLADRQKRYVASESSFYRVMHEEGLMAHRGHARPSKGSTPRCHVASGPCQVWSWDITYLRASVRGTFYYLYLVLDIWSRTIVGWAVHAEESAELGAALAEKAVRDEDVSPGQLVVHADNGGPMKGATMLATLQRLGIAASFSRPNVSDDNAACEAIFRTLKYRPGYPRKPFASIEAARKWVEDFVAWYNREHLHSALRYVTPNSRHLGHDKAILAARHKLYVASKKATPRRWTGPTRNWTPIGDVTLNPKGARTDAA